MIRINSSKYKILTTLSLIGMLLYVFPLSVNAQNSKNPFEIKNRVNDSIQIDTIDTENTIIDSIASNVNAPLNNSEEISTEFINNINPFEVDHIPLRKKDVIQKKNRQQVSNPINKTTSSKSFIYWFLILGLILLTLASTAQKKLISKVSKSIFNENILKQEHRSGNSITLEYLLLYLVYLINAAIFILLLWNYFDGGELSILNFGFCFLFLGLIYSIRHIVMNVFGFIFPLEKEAKLYSFTIQLFNAFVGIVLIPINLFLAFAPENITKIALFCGLGIISILLIIRVVRGLTIAINYIFNNIVLFFIYLCALEIAPILVLVKLLSKI